MPRPNADPDVEQEGSADGKRYEPEWGSTGWPRLGPGGLDESDQLLVQSMLALTPVERLKALSDFVDGLSEVRRTERLRSD